MVFQKGHTYLNTGRTQFKKGFTPWNKGLNGVQKGANLGKKFNLEFREKARQRQLGKHLSEQAKEKLRLFRIGKHLSAEAKLKVSIARKDKPLSEEHKLKLSIAREGLLIGNKHPAWNGGSSNKPYTGFTNRIKKSIRDRDKHICQECHQTEEQLGYKLHVHHIDYDKKNNSPENLISLCNSCHSQTNFNRTDWQNYFKDIIGGQQ